MTSTVYTYRGRNRDITCGDATGTVAGYNRHRYWGEPACDPCREAERLRGLKRSREAGFKPFTPAACGTRSGYKKHIRDGEPPCDDCTYANRLKSRRSRQISATGIYCTAPKPCSRFGYRWHKRRNETPCPACTHWNRVEERARRG